MRDGMERLAACRGRLLVLVAAIGLALLGAVTGGAQTSGPPVPAAEPQAFGPNDCAQVLSLLETQKTEWSQELRRLHRELAALKQQLDKPGLSAVFTGIGYILGLFGVAFFVHARTTYRRRSGEE